jgi:hypothetical protein
MSEDDCRGQVGWLMIITRVGETARRSATSRYHRESASCTHVSVEHIRHAGTIPTVQSHTVHNESS